MSRANTTVEKELAAIRKRVARAHPGAARRLGAATSKIAAMEVAPKTGTQRWRVLQAIVAHGPITRDHLEEILGISANTIRPRVKELLRDGFVVVGPALARSNSGHACQVLKATDIGNYAVKNGRLK